MQQLAVTRINVAHRPEVTSETDRIFWVNRTCEPLGRLGKRKSVPRGGVRYAERTGGAAGNSVERKRPKPVLLDPYQAAIPFPS